MSSISVILPVLNGMPYLQEALASLETQTLRDFEVILWDNGSTDGTVQLARQWIPGRLPGRIVTGNALPLHLCLARMVEESPSEFCARMDADDVCLPQRFEWQLRYLKTHPATAVVGGQMNLIDSFGRPLPSQVHSPLDQAGVLLQMLWSNPMPHPALMFRRQSVLAAGNYAVPKPVEDFDLWLRMAARDEGLINLPETVLLYRRHEASICHAELQNGHLHQTLQQCLSGHAPELFGLSQSSHLAMLKQNQPFAFWLLEKALRRIARRTGMTPGQLRRRKEYREAGRMLTSRRDMVSRLYLRFLEIAYS